MLLLACVIPAMAAADPDGDAVDSISSLKTNVKKVDTFGDFDLIEGVVIGDYVAFNITEENGAISNFTLVSNSGPIRLIQEMSFEDLALTDDAIKVTGSVMKYGNDTIDVKIHDNPTGNMQIKNKGVEENITILLDAGLTADVQENDDGSKAVFLEGNGILGLVRTVNGTIDIDVIDEGTYVNITLDAKDYLQVLFRPMVGERNGAIERAALEGIMDGTLASEVSISAGTDGIGYEEMTYDEAMAVEVGEQEDGDLIIEVSSEIDEGRVLFINIDDEVLDGSTDLKVRMDGIVLSDLSSPEDVIDAARSSSEDAVFYLVHTGEIAQLLVYIPTFSTHEIVISPNPIGYGSMEWGLAVFGAVGIICLAGYLVLRRT